MARRLGERVNQAEGVGEGMSTSATHIKLGRDRDVPVGWPAGADDVVDADAPAGGVPEPELPIIFIKLARILAIRLAASSFGPEPVEGGGYRIRGSSGNHKTAESPTHSHCIPAIHTARLTLIYSSLRDWRSKRDGYKKRVRLIYGKYFGCSAM